MKFFAAAFLLFLLLPAHAEGVAPVDAGECAAMKAHHVLNADAPVGCDRLDVVTFDYLGFDGVVVNEHHQTAYGMMPTPGVLAGALALALGLPFAARMAPHWLVSAPFTYSTSSAPERGSPKPVLTHQ